MIICLTGMPGSGKTEAACILRKMKFRTVEMVDSVKDMMKERGIKVNNKSIRMFSVELRKSRGPTIFAIETAKRLKKTGKSEKLCIVGVRSVEEIHYFKKSLPEMRVIALTAPKKIRFSRMLVRKRKDDSKEIKGLEFRERKEVQFGMLKAIETADFIVANIGSRTELGKNLKEVVRLL